LDIYLFKLIIDQVGLYIRFVFESEARVRQTDGRTDKMLLLSFTAKLGYLGLYLRVRRPVVKRNFSVSVFHINQALTGSQLKRNHLQKYNQLFTR